MEDSRRFTCQCCLLDLFGVVGRGCLDGERLEANGISDLSSVFVLLYVLVVRFAVITDSSCLVDGFLADMLRANIRCWIVT